MNSRFRTVPVHWQGSEEILGEFVFKVMTAFTSDLIPIKCMLRENGVYEMQPCTELYGCHWRIIAYQDFRYAECQVIGQDQAKKLLRTIDDLDRRGRTREVDQVRARLFQTEQRQGV